MSTDKTFKYLENTCNEFENLVDELPLGILSCDREGNITAVNDFLLNILGSPSAEATKNINLLKFPALIKSGISAALEEALTTGKNTSIETPYKSKWDKELFLSFKAFPLKTGGGEIHGCHVIIEDLTSKREANAEIEGNKRKDKLISRISNRFINSSFKDIDEHISETLKELAVFIGADRAAIFSAEENTDYIVKTHEWHIAEIESKIPFNQKWDTKKLLFERLSNLQIVNIPDVDKIPDENEALKKVFQHLEIKSIALIPLSRYGIFKGFIGVDSKKKQRVWNENDLYVLKIAGDIIANVLERKNTEKILLQKEKDYDEVVNSIDSIIWKATFDKNGKPLNAYISEPVDRILGLPKGSIDNNWDKYFEYIHPDDLQKVKIAIKRAFKDTGITLDVDYRMMVKDGRTIWMNSTGTTELLENGTYQSYGTSVDVTEKKMAEDELVKSEEKYRSLIEQSSDAIFLNGLDGKIVEVNNRACVMLGYSKDDLENMTIHDLLTPDRRKFGQEEMRRLQIEGIIRTDTKYLTSTRNVIDVEMSAQLLEGYPGLAQTIIRDITERKKSEEKLKLSERRYRDLIGQLSDALIINTFAGEILEVNDKACEMLGYSREELENMSVFDLISPSWRDSTRADLAAIIQKKTIQVESEFITADGNVIDIEVNAKALEGYHNMAQVIVRDVTERKAAEEKLRESEALLNKVGRIAKIGGWELDVESNALTWTPEVAKIHETNDLHTLETGLNRFPPDSRIIVEKAMSNAIEKGEPYDLEVESITAKGNYKWLRVIGNPLTKDGKVIKITGSVQDITERKTAENKLIENEEKLRLFIENAPAALVMLDRDMRHIATTRQWLDIYSFDENDVIGKFHYDVLPDIKEEYRDAHRRALEGEVVRKDEERVVLANGRVEWSRWEVKPWKTNDGIIGGIIILAENITERKLAENKLLESEEQLRLFIEHAPVDLAMFDRNMCYIAASKRWNKTFSLDERDLKGLCHYDLFPEISDEWKSVHRRSLKGEVIRNNEDPFKRADGRVQWLRWEVRPWKAADGTIGGIVIFSEDITKRKESEDELKHKEEKYRSLFEQSNDAIFLNHIDGQIVDVNEKACEMFGYTKEQFKKMNVSDLLAPYHKNTGELEMHQFREDGGVDVHALYAKANGETFDAEVNAKVLEGTPDLAQSIVRDISKQKEAEDKLRESEEKFRLFIEHAPVSLAMFDNDMRHIAVSQLWLDEFSPDNRDIIGLNHYDVFPWIPDEFKEAHRRGLQGEVVRKDDHMFLQDDGSIWWTRWEVRPWKMTDGDIGGIIIFSEDITKRKEAEIAIKESEIKYRSLFERSNDAVLIHEFNGKVVDVNNRACEMLDYTKEELKHKTITDLILPEDRSIIAEATSDLKSKGLARNEARMIRGDGNIIYMDITGSVIKNGLIQAVGRDVTERVQAESVMLNAKIEAETANRTKSEFLANMSHELRTPLNSIIGFSDAMIDGMAGELGTKQERYLQNISDSGHHLLGLINDILDISKIEAGKMELNFDQINIPVIINEIITMMRPLASEKNITVYVNLPDDLPKVMADRSKIKQILYNLVGNALKFTNNNGRITIHVEVKNSDIQISVIDTGVGISPIDQKKLFKPFSQIDSSISRKYAGTGLGLALVKEIVELHDGKVWVESEPGRGSTFTFEIPIGKADRNTSF